MNTSQAKHNGCDKVLLLERGRRPWIVGLPFPAPMYLAKYNPLAIVAMLYLQIAYVGVGR